MHPNLREPLWYPSIEWRQPPPKILEFQFKDSISKFQHNLFCSCECNFSPMFLFGNIYRPLRLEDTGKCVTFRYVGLGMVPALDEPENKTEYDLVEWVRFGRMFEEFKKYNVDGDDKDFFRWKWTKFMAIYRVCRGASFPTYSREFRLLSRIYGQRSIWIREKMRTQDFSVGKSRYYAVLRYLQRKILTHFRFRL